MLIGGETMETMTDFIFLGSETTEDGDFTHEMMGPDAMILVL